MSDSPKKPEHLSPADEAWFQTGAPVPDDFIDPDLSGDEGARSVGQGLILILVAAFAVLLSVQYTLELQYFFTEREPIVLNEGADESLFIAPQWRDERGNLKVESNRFVRVAGIPERRSVSGDREFYSLVGSQLYVERRVIDDRPRVLQGTPRPVERGMESARVLFEGEGRIVAFQDLPRRYKRFIDFYSDGYRLHFCGFEPSEELRSYQFRVRRQATTQLIDTLGREPTEEELREETGPLGYCQDGYLLIADERPGDFWFYPLFYLAFISIIAGAGYFLFQRFRKREE